MKRNAPIIFERNVVLDLPLLILVFHELTPELLAIIKFYTNFSLEDLLINCTNEPPANLSCLFFTNYTLQTAATNKIYEM